MKTEWRTPTKYIVGVGLTLIGLYILYLSRSVLSLLIIGALIAFLVRPFVSFFRRRLRFPRALAVLVTYLLVIVVLLLAPLVLIPPIINAANYLLALDYQGLINNFLGWSEETLLAAKAGGFRILGFNFYFDGVIDPLLAVLQNTAPEFSPALPSLPVIIESLGSAFTVSFGVAVNLVGSVSSGVLGFVYLVVAGVYLSLSSDNLQDGFLGWFPIPFRSEIEKLLEQLKFTWDAFFRGQITLMFLIGLIIWLGNTVLGLPGAFALGILSGLLEIIPNLGPFLALIPAVTVALLQGSTHLPVNNFVFALIVLVFYLLVQQFENIYIVPRVLGGAVELHPLVVMTGVLIGASVAGILGALLAAPVIASGKLIFTYLYSKMLGQEPFPTRETIPEVVSPPPPEWVDNLTTKVKGLVSRQTEPDSREDGSAKEESSEDGSPETEVRSG
jgi:predicted PurR-regulated permease PerM